jgi:Mrp family chromosome partitioning ATPase
MSKIYEALEHARRELHEVRQPVEDEAVEPQVTAPAEQPPDAPLTTSPTIPLVSVEHELSLEREMTALYQSINSLLSDTSHKIIQFISSRPGEGTSTIIRELAKVITTLMGRPVLLLDIDRTHTSPRGFFGCASPPELDEVVKGTLPIDQAVCQVENTTLFVSPLFQHSVLTPQKLGSQATDQLWDQLRQRFEYVLIDSPPISASSDGLAIVRKVDGVIFVVEAEKTRWPVALAAKEKIVSHGGNVLGMVFNKRRFYIPEFVYRKI